MCNQDSNTTIVEWAEVNPDRWQAEQQRPAFEKRFERARETAERHGLLDQFDRYTNHVGSESEAIVCTSPPLLWRWVSGDPLTSDEGGYRSRYKSLQRGEFRVSLGDDWDLIRRRVDTVFFPYYEEEICFAALSLNDAGCRAYGCCAVKLKTKKIADRATVFPTDSIAFFRRRKFPLLNRLPRGYLATFENRGRLAAMKALEQGLLRQSLSSETEMQRILIWYTNSKVQADFVEVRIFGELQSSDILNVYFDPIAMRNDEDLSGLQDLLSNQGIPWS